MFQKLAAITANTFVETVRQPVYSVLLWVVAFWVAYLSPALAGFTLASGNDQKVMIDVSLATLMLYSLLVSVFSAAGVITREIESHTVLTVIAKPVSRPVFLLGKYFGVSGAVLVGYYFLTLVLFMTVRHGTMETASDRYDQPVLIFGLGAVVVSLLAATFGNYVYGWHFSTALTAWAVPLVTVALVLTLFIGPEWELQSLDSEFGKGVDIGKLQLLYGAVSCFGGVLILVAWAVALATRFGQVLTLMLCAGVFMLGLLSDYYIGSRLAEGPLYRVLYAVVPNFQFFWLGDPITEGLKVGGKHVALAAAYAGLYAAAVLALGVALFETREVS